MIVWAGRTSEPKSAHGRAQARVPGPDMPSRDASREDRDEHHHGATETPPPDWFSTRPAAGATPVARPHARRAGVTEAEARAALAAVVAIGDMEAWIAEQPWEATQGGWTVLGGLHGLRFRVEPAGGGVRVIASAARGEPEVWIVPTG